MPLPLPGNESEYISSEESRKYLGRSVRCIQDENSPPPVPPAPKFDLLTYEGQTYRTVEIGSQTWMAENLNYNAEGSKCYNNAAANCEISGRLYNWATAMEVCPDGWHLPNASDWDILMGYVQTDNGRSYTSGGEAFAKYFKAESGWPDRYEQGTDDYGFAALPGGSSNGSTYNSADYGYWWSSAEYDSNKAYIRQIAYFRGEVQWGDFDKSNLVSVRCVQD
jgi:uncharacterized protein (TIGR02145 family)